MGPGLISSPGDAPDRLRTGAAGAFALATTPLRAPADVVGHTALWMVPVAGAGGRVVQVGVRGGDRGPTTYSLSILGERGPLVAPTLVTVSPGETVTRSLSVPADAGANVVALLDGPGVHRHTDLRLGTA